MTIEIIIANILAKKKEIAAKTAEMENFEITVSDSQYDEMLDEEGEINIGGLSFYPSDIIKNCDPIAYHCGKIDYQSNLDKEDVEEYRDLESELEDLEGELEDLESELEEAEENE